MLDRDTVDIIAYAINGHAKALDRLTNELRSIFYLQGLGESLSAIARALATKDDPTKDASTDRPDHPGGGLSAG